MSKGIPIDIPSACDALILKKGIVAHAAKHIGVDRTRIFLLMHDYPELVEARNKGLQIGVLERRGMEDEMRDMLYEKAKQKIDEGDTTTVIFGLKALCGWNDGKSAPQTVTNASDIIQKAKNGELAREGD